MQIIGIMGAIPEEVDIITAALEDSQMQTYAGVQYHIGKKHGKTVIACCAGMCKVNAAGTTQVLITKFGADAIIFSGIAGNMSSEIGIGDVVISGEVVYHDADLRMIAQSAPGTRSYTANPLLIDAVKKACEACKVHYLVGRIATGDQFVGDTETKNRIKAQCNPACVEMEGAAVGHVAQRNGVPFVVIRAMSDNCEESVESLGAEEFDVSEYVKTSSAIVLAAIDMVAGS